MKISAQSGRGALSVVPLTSDTARVHRFQVLPPATAVGPRADSKAPCERLRAVAAERVPHRIGAVPDGLMKQLDAALRRRLAL